jgi:hypothetical protein
MQLRERLTVIMTTSAIRSHPSTEMISKVRASFALIEVLVRSCLTIAVLTVRLHARPQGLLDCPQIIVADGASIAETSELKKGKVTASLAARYNEYLQRLADVLDAETAQLHVQVHPPPAFFGPSLTTGMLQRLLIVREKRYGYAENLRYFRSHLPFCARFCSLRSLRHALLACRTSHVLVVQHDQCFLRPMHATNLERLVQLLDCEPHVCTCLPSLLEPQRRGD